MPRSTSQRNVAIAIMVLAYAALTLPVAQAQEGHAPTASPELWLKVVHGSGESPGSSGGLASRPDWRHWQRNNEHVQLQIREVLAKKKAGKYDAATEDHDVAMFELRDNEGNSLGAPPLPVLLDNEDAIQLVPHLLSVTSTEALARRIDIRLDPPGAVRMQVLSRRHSGEALAVVLNGRILTAPILHGAMEDQLRITGSFTKTEVDEFVSTLRGAMTKAQPRGKHEPGSPKTEEEAE